MNWQQIVTQLGTTAILAATLAWISRTFVQHLLSRDLDRHKLRLESEHQRDLESFRSDLQRLMFEHSTIFSHLHEKRLQVLSDLFSNIVQLERLVRIYLSPYPLWRQRESDTENLKKAWSAYDDLHNHYDKNRIYLPADLCKIVDDLLNALAQPTIDFTLGRIFDSQSPNDPEVTSFRNEVREQLNETVPAAKAAVENEFRRLIGTLPEALQTLPVRSPMPRESHTPAVSENE